MDGVAGALGMVPAAPSPALQSFLEDSARAVSGPGGSQQPQSPMPPAQTQLLSEAEQLAMRVAQRRREQQLEHGRALQKQANEQHQRRRASAAQDRQQPSPAAAPGAAQTRPASQPRPAAASAPFGTDTNASTTEMDEYHATIRGSVKGRGAFSPSARMQDLRSSAVHRASGVVQAQADARPARRRIIAGNTQSSGAEVSVKPRHPMALAQAARQAAESEASLVDIYGHRHGHRVRALDLTQPTEKDLDELLVQVEAATTNKGGEDNDEEDENADGALRGFVRSLRQRDAPTASAAPADFTEAMYSKEDRREEKMAASLEQQAAVQSNEWAEGVGQLSSALGELQGMLQLDEPAAAADGAAADLSGAPLGVDARAMADASQTLADAQGQAAQAEALLHWTRPPPSESSATASHAGATAGGAPDLAMDVGAMREEVQRLAVEAQAAASAAAAMTAAQTRTPLDKQAKKEFLKGTADVHVRPLAHLFAALLATHRSHLRKC